MIHPDTEVRYIDAVVGRGVFATRLIPRGTIVWTLCAFDRVYRPDEAAALPEPYQAILDVHAYQDGQGRTILCWDGGRYENHSCDPNTLGLLPEIDVAVRDIVAGEQITCEYGSLNLSETLDCRCGSKACRGQIGREDARIHAPAWDARVAAVLPRVVRVPQPLLRFVADREALEAVLSGRTPRLGHTDSCQVQSRGWSDVR